ncbi:hypothetical protein [Perlabentimonas gracilis]|uniref:hypothetical protein n=1 Tax=Perlabentimonas gracilis TaxID=2715279 RepID=UPI001409A0F1|nr:hypothetical protein [Perlabentimonas gracilis]NHB69541.1 hypothetical protein [Perlabentimonas gracilis]
MDERQNMSYFIEQNFLLLRVKFSFPFNMVRTINNKLIIMVGFLLTMIPAKAIAQSSSCSDFPLLENFRKWGIVAGPVLYSSAKVNPNYGDYQLENLPQPGFNIGVVYDFLPYSMFP